MSRYHKPKYIVLGIAVVVFCFVPMINMPYEVIVQKQVEEEYTTVEPYTVQQEAREPYTEYVYSTVLEPYMEWEYPRNERGLIDFSTGFGKSVEKYREALKQTPVTRWRTVTKEVTKYREVTKTQLVTRPVVETRTKRVSILRYLLR